MYGQTENQDKQKKKIIIAALIMGVIIIILIGVLINAITSKNKNKVAANPESTAVIREDEKANQAKIEENKKEEEENPEDAKLDPVANDKKEETIVTPSYDTKSEAATTAATDNAAATDSNLPSTGPAGALGLAVLAGSATTYAFSRKKIA